MTPIIYKKALQIDGHDMLGVNVPPDYMGAVDIWYKDSLTPIAVTRYEDVYRWEDVQKILNISDPEKNPKTEVFPSSVVICKGNIIVHYLTGPQIKYYGYRWGGYHTPEEAIEAYCNDNKTQPVGI